MPTYAFPNSPRPLGIWGIPRGGTTAFRRMIHARGDMNAVHEPFTGAYFFGPERTSRYNDLSLMEPEETHALALKRLEDVSKSEKRTCVKELAFQLRTCLNADFLSHFQSSLMIRHPRFALASLRKIWPDFTEVESGFGSVHDAMCIIRDLGERLVVIDGMDLTQRPEQTVRAWCDIMELKYIPEALNWEGGCFPWKHRAVFDTFRDKARDSNGMGNIVVKEPFIDEWLAKRIDSTMPFYNELEMHIMKV